MNKKLLLALLLASALPISAFAQQGGVTIQSMIYAAEQTALFIASGVVVILWIMTGIMFLTAQGDPSKVSSAKHALFSAVAGTILVIVAGSAIALISNAFGIGNS